MTEKELSKKRAWNREYMRRKKLSDPVKYAEWMRASSKRKRGSLKVLAQKSLARAVKKGTIVRPDSCEKCGKKGKPHGHHDDYSKRLDVRWVCQACHQQIHNDLRKANGNRHGC